MERDWTALGRALADGRKRCHLSQVTLAERIGVSRTPIQAIERGQGFDKVTGTIRSYARAIGWTDESIDKVLDGGEPDLINPPPADAAEAAPLGSASRSDLPLEIESELGEGDLLAATVLNLTQDGSDVRVIVVVRGAPTKSPDQISKNLEIWRKAQRALRTIEDSPSES